MNRISRRARKERKGEIGEMREDDITLHIGIRTDLIVINFNTALIKDGIKKIVNKL